VDLDLAQVRAFVAVVDHAHFGRAAAALSLTQQALSKRVGRLEAALGPLLLRRRDGAVPTEAGARFLPAARRLLEVADRAVAEAREAPAPPLRVDVWGELQSPARAMRSIALDHPSLVVELSMRRDLAKAVAALERHEVDLVFGDASRLQQPLPDALVAERVLTDEIGLLVNENSVWAEREVLAPMVLDRIWFPLAGSSPELRAFAEEYARTVGVELIPIGANVGLAELVRRVVTDPEIVTCVVLDWPLTGVSGVRVLRLDPPPRYPWYAVWRRGDDHPALPLVQRELRAAAGRSRVPTSAGD
jgi:DNA-binding transcriptional LysR family regulator